jgi:5'(3')-deoxyribonucleotidase
MTLRVGIDLDGVLADFRSAFRQAVRALPELLDGLEGSPGSLGEPELKRAWKEISGRVNWWTNLQPYEPGQIGRLYTLARQLKWEVYFLTKRPGTEGDSVQFQTQWWLEQHGFYLPSVLTVPGSRGELANALHLDIVIDDQPLNCVEVISASPAKALLMSRDPNAHAQRERALSRGIGAVTTLEEGISVLERLHAIMPSRRGRLLRLSDWLPGVRRDEPQLPLDPRAGRPLPGHARPTRSRREPT